LPTAAESGVTPFAGSAAFALGKIGDARVLPALREAQEHDLGTDFQGCTIRQIAEVAIEEIEERQRS